MKFYTSQGNKYQIVYPPGRRGGDRVKVGDMLETKVEAGKITFTPKSLVDHSVAESLADFGAGRSYGPFKTHEELINSLHKESESWLASNSKWFPKRTATRGPADLR